MSFKYSFLFVKYSNDEIKSEINQIRPNQYNYVALKNTYKCEL